MAVAAAAKRPFGVFAEWSEREPCSPLRPDFPAEFAREPAPKRAISDAWWASQHAHVRAAAVAPQTAALPPAVAAGAQGGTGHAPSSPLPPLADDGGSMMARPESGAPARESAEAATAAPAPAPRASGPSGGNSLIRTKRPFDLISRARAAHAAAAAAAAAAPRVPSADEAQYGEAKVPSPEAAAAGGGGGAPSSSSSSSAAAATANPPAASEAPSGGYLGVAKRSRNARDYVYQSTNTMDDSGDDSEKNPFSEVESPYRAATALPQRRRKRYTEAQVLEIVERALAEQKTALEEEYRALLNRLLQEQWENFATFNSDYISRHFKREAECPYMS